MISLPNLPFDMPAMDMRDFESKTPTPQKLSAMHETFLTQFKAFENYWRSLKLQQTDFLTLSDADQYIRELIRSKELDVLLPNNGQLTMPVRFFPSEARQIFDSTNVPTTVKEHAGFIIIMNKDGQKTYLLTHPEVSKLRYKITYRINNKVEYCESYRPPNVIEDPIKGHELLLRGHPIEYATNKFANHSLTEQLRALESKDLFIRLENANGAHGLKPTATLDYRPKQLLGLKRALPEQASLMGKRICFSDDINIVTAVTNLLNAINDQPVIVGQKSIKVPKFETLDPNKLVPNSSLDI